jgi:hypothetical protein
MEGSRQDLRKGEVGDGLKAGLRRGHGPTTPNVLAWQVRLTAAPHQTRQTRQAHVNTKHSGDQGPNSS